MNGRLRNLASLTLLLALALSYLLIARSSEQPENFLAAGSPTFEALPPITELPALDPPPLAKFSSWVERPPMRQSRRPSVEAPPPEPPPPAPPSAPPAFTAKLLGVRIQPDNRAALFQGSGERNARWMAEGEILTGWTIHRIEKGGVYLRFADQPYELRLWPE